MALKPYRKRFTGDEAGAERSAESWQSAGAQAVIGPGIARDLAYRLYTLCERKGWAEEAGYYNSLAVAWPAISNVPELFQVR